MRLKTNEARTISALAVACLIGLFLPTNAVQARSIPAASLAHPGHQLFTNGYLVNPANEPPCVKKGFFRKEDCSLRDLFRRVNEGSNRDILGMHIFLASKDISSTKSFFGPIAKTAAAGNSACLGAMRNAQLQMVPTLGGSLSNVSKGLRFIDGVGTALSAADRIGQSQRILTLLIEGGVKAAATQIGKEAAAEKLPDLKSTLTEVAKALTTALASYSINNQVRADYLYAVMSSGSC